MRYADLAELKGDFDIGDTRDDTRLNLALDAASRVVDHFTRRTFTPVNPDVDVATVRTYEASRLRTLSIDDAVSISLVEEESHGEFSEVDWTALPRNAEADGVPFTRLRRDSGRWRGDVRVTAWFGWREVPPAVIRATLMQAAVFFKRKEAVFGVAEIPMIDGAVGHQLRSMLDPHVRILLQPYVRAVPGLVG